MKTSANSFLFAIFVFSFVLFSACGPKSDTNASASTQETNTTAANDQAETVAEKEPDYDVDFLNRLQKEKWSGDIKGMVERRYIRALVLYNKTNFFYDGPQPRGVTYEALKGFEKFLNTRLQTGDQPIHIVFIPVTRKEAFKRMSEGRGDIAASNAAILPEYQKLVDFSDPVRENVKEVIVTGPNAPQIASVDDLAGKEVFVRKLSRYWPTLQNLNTQFKQAGKPEMKFNIADDNLEDEDVLNMVNSGVVGITVADDLVAGFWSKVYDQLKVHDDIVLSADDKIGWAVQKGTPEFLALINEYVDANKVGTTQGNVLVQKYYKDTKWATNNVAPAEMAKFKEAAGYFKKYGVINDFDWLLVAAQAYQESQIDQSRRSGAGAVGVMQIKPSTAADKPLFIKDVDTNMENNIKAGTGYMDYILKTNLKDAKMDKINRSLFAMASYNAGPARIEKLREEAKDQGLDPNVWFNNVEIVAAKDIGPETVNYVSNIYKYYIGYKLATEVLASRKNKTG
jgi:membrane-bound lytic murein transglycosylase MltF